ncbi:hypothetical protein [Sulfitobacter geojensis]|uniref:hypothetical protein n=1 Tax=Sulfitobacter geojensis TaxID=1342299 RepID=UPI0010FD659F|nr:hypothetical protein [Sulfitobacter geojensis]
MKNWIKYLRLYLHARATLQAACNKTSEGDAQVKQILTAALRFTTLAFPSFAQETARPAKVITVKEETDQIVRSFPHRKNATAAGNRKPRHRTRRRQTRRDRGIVGRHPRDRCANHCDLVCTGTGICFVNAAVCCIGQR